MWASVEAGWPVVRTHLWQFAGPHQSPRLSWDHLLAAVEREADRPPWIAASVAISIALMIIDQIVGLSSCSCARE